MHLSCTKLQSCTPYLYKNIFYKNVKAEILRIFNNLEARILKRI